MVSNVSSLTNNGLRDWLLQRATAIIIGAYVVSMFIYLAIHPNLTFANWQALFSHAWFKALSLICLLSIVLHAWIGFWTVATDYIKPTALRNGFYLLLLVGLLFILLWGTEILWGINR